MHCYVAIPDLQSSNQYCYIVFTEWIPAYTVNMNDSTSQLHNSKLYMVPKTQTPLFKRGNGNMPLMSGPKTSFLEPVLKQTL